MRISPRTRRRSAWACLVAALTIGSSACAGAQAMDDPDECSVREVSRRPLMVGTGAHYIEHRVSVASGGELLIAGKPTYEWADFLSSPVLVGMNTVFGAAVDSAGAARIIPPPIRNARVKAQAAVSIGDAAWGIIFSEHAAGADTAQWVWDRDTTTGGIVRLWYAELRRSEWGPLTRLPLPDDVKHLPPWRNSELVASGDTIIWAYQEITDAKPRAALLERIDGKWSRQTVELNRMTTPGYLALAHTADGGFMLGVADLDETLGTAGNSLLLFARNPSWRLIRRVVAARDHDVHYPMLTPFARDSLLLTWQGEFDPERPFNWARVHIDGGASPVQTPAHGVDEPVWPIGGAPGGPYVLVRTASLPPQPRITLWRMSGETATVAWTAFDPFAGSFKPVSIGRSIVVPGPLLDREKETLTTQILTLELQCPTRRSHPRR